MKKITAIITSILIFCTLLAGCGANNAQKPNGGDSIKIGIAAPDATHGWVAGVAYHAEKYCKEQNVEYKIITSKDAAQMVTVLNDLAEWGAQVIVTYPQWTGMESGIQEIVDKGIKVVCFDIDVKCDDIYKVAGDNYGMGYKSAEYIVKKAGPAASIAVLDVPSAGSVSALRKQGFYDYMKENNYDTSNVFEISMAAMTRDNGLRDMTDILQSHSRVDAVFSMDDEISIGVVQAIEETGRHDVKAITGGGGMQEYFKMIADEKYKDLGLASALYSPSMIVDAIKTGINLAKGGTSEKEIQIPTTIVDDENVNDYIDPSNTIY